MRYLRPRTLAFSGASIHDNTLVRIALAETISNSPGTGLRDRDFWISDLVSDSANLINLPPPLFSSNAFHQAPFNPKRGGGLGLSGWLDGFVRPIFVNRERLAKTFEMTKFSVPQFASNFFKRFDYIFSI